MSDPRPAPQFGEYATREEQLAHIAEPTEWQLNPTELKDTEQKATEQKATAQKTTGQKAPNAATSAGSKRATQATPAAVNSNNRFNMVATLVFLVYGLFEVVTTVPAFLQLGVLINDQLTVIGTSQSTTFDTYQSTAATQYAGYGLIALWVTLWLAAALWSWQRIRAQKLAMWVPFVAGVIANVALSVTIAVLVFNDPTLAAQLMSVVTGGTQ